MKIAYLVKDNLQGWQGHAALYKLGEPMVTRDWTDEEVYDYCEFVIVSAVDAMFSGPETYIFPADENGEAVSMIELSGSYRGGFDHEKALNKAGYHVDFNTDGKMLLPAGEE